LDQFASLDRGVLDGVSVGTTSSVGVVFAVIVCPPSLSRVVL
jgi:hypothetical protein